jgi:hypothetical protein
MNDLDGFYESKRTSKRNELSKLEEQHRAVLIGI